MTIKEAAINLINKAIRYNSKGYGQYTCVNCGALKQIDYGDHDQPTTEKEEEHSRNCCWRILKEAIESES
jgi:hypothetical protein